ncbi:MAG: DUF1761 domain-containing protein [Chitinophagales bacterium]
MQYPVNMLAAVGASFVGLLVGFVWYHPKVFGTIWMKESGLSADGPKPNMALTFGLTWLFCLILAVFVAPLCIHQVGFFSMLQGHDDGTMARIYQDVMASYGHSYRTFRHGLLHGTLAGIFVVTPLIGVPALFEQKSWKYILINAGYWTVTLAIMCAILCHFVPAAA